MACGTSFDYFLADWLKDKPTVKSFIVFFFVVVPLTVAIIYLIISNMSIDNCKIPVFGLPTLSLYSKKRDNGVYFTRNFRLKIHFSS